MTNTIDEAVLTEVARSLTTETPDQGIVHTVTVTLNGQHGGVDVTASMSLPWVDDYEKTWMVR